jgi:ubiquinone/menaquinone biosynthesis C-methylase UbiE
MPPDYRDSFGPVARHYVQSATHADPVSLARMCALTGAQRGRTAMDLASGGGHAAFALATAGCAVTACDGTREMLVASAEEAARRGVTMARLLADAHRIPSRPASWDIVTCRFAAHHFANPLTVLREVSRVLGRRGRFYLYDLSSPENNAMGRWLDSIEALRDPSHVCCWSSRAWEGLALGAGLRIVHSARYRRQYRMDHWLGRPDIAAGVREEIVARLRAMPPSWYEELSVDLTQDPPVFGTPMVEIVAEKT